MTDAALRELIPADERRRLEALHRLGVLDTEREERFDGLVAELARQLDAPIAYLALIAEDRQWLKSKVGPLPTQCKREDAFCSRTILGTEPLLVADARNDDRFSSSPLVQGDPHLRFYAGVPIADRTGQAVGTVCVAGPQPRDLTPRDVAILMGFAHRLERELNTRPTVLVAYAEEDVALIGRLIATDRRLDDPGTLDLWSSRRLTEASGPAWKLEEALSRARAAVLMVSPAFLRSGFATTGAFHPLLGARELDGLVVRMVVLEPCDLASVAWLADRAPWPPDGQAVTDRLLGDLAVELIGQPTDTTRTSRKENPQVFLSHASEDAAAVKHLASKLRQGGVDVWLDIDELEPGDDWMASLELALDESDAFAVYVGRSGIVRWIGREVRVALDRNAKDPRFRFIPILGPGSDPESLPRFVAQHHWLDLRAGDPDPKEIRRLVGSILSRPAETVSLLSPGEPPFRGLLTFGVEDAHLFFGRDEETRELLERLQTSPFLAVIGDSGSGKSSLVRAGLIPALHRGHFKDRAAKSPTWRVVVIKPGRDPFGQLASGLLDLVTDSSPAERLSILDVCTAQLSQGTRGLCNAVAALLPSGVSTLLVIDQFEEVFTQSQDPDERDRFIDTLLAASTGDGERPLYTLVTLRADFYSQCFEHPTLPTVVSTNQYAVRAIASERLVDVIAKPAEMAGLRLEPGLVDAILFDLGEGPGNLPLLEHTLLQLWKRRVGETLTHDSYEEIGRVQGALEHHAEEVYGKFDPTQQILAHKLLLGLVVPTENAGPVRRRARVSEILPLGGQSEAAEQVLQRLIDERLLMVRGFLGDGAQVDREVEVAHEALLRGWTRLRRWLDEDREFLFWRQRATAAFAAWEDSRRDQGALLRGAPLAEAVRWLETRSEDLSEDGRSFIRASMARERRQRLVWRAVMTAVTLMGITALAFAVVATRARREAEQSLVLATTAVDEMLTKVGSEALEDVPQLEEVRQELLGKARTLYEQLSAQRSSASSLGLQTATAPARMAEIQRQLGETQAAKESLAAAIRELGALGGAGDGEPAAQLELAKVHDEMGRVVEESASDGGALAEAAAHYGSAIGIQKALVARSPHNAQYAYELARSHLNRGILRYKIGELESAEQDYSAAIAYVEPLASRPSEWKDAILQQLARTRNQLANLYQKQKKSSEAAESYKRAAELFESLIAEHPGSRQYRTELAKTYNNLALHQRKNGDLVEAEDFSGRAVALLADLAEALPAIRSEWANSYSTQGMVFLELDRTEAAISSLKRASEIFADLLSDYPDRPDDRFRDAVTLVYLGSLQATRGDGAEVSRIRARLAEIVPLLPPEERTRIESHPSYRQILGAP